MSHLNEILTEAGLQPLSQELTDRFAAYLALLVKWNSKLNLTAIRSEDEILRRHFAECIFAAQQIPSGAKTLLDFGSGAGFPGIPISLCRPEIRVTLAESQSKKCAFLRECVRTLETSATVSCGRGEEISESFDIVALRAVDKMAEAVQHAALRVSPGGILLLMTTEAYGFASVLPSFELFPTILIPMSEREVLLMGRRKQ
jgi:16S rRNA (guanine527-N7)-methyltransferase